MEQGEKKKSVMRNGCRKYELIREQETSDEVRDKRKKRDMAKEKPVTDALRFCLLLLSLMPAVGD